MANMKNAVKILAVVLVAAAAVVLLHHLPSFEHLMRQIHGI